MKRRLAALIALLGALAGAAAFWRSRSGSGRERADVYFPDGSLVTFAEGTEEAARLFPPARRILAQARS